MPYCRKCGATLDEDASFCRNCGTPVENASIRSTTPSRPVRRRNVFPVAILIGILLVAFFAVVFVFVPFRSINQSQTYVAYTVPDVNTVNLNFDADVADVTIIPTDLPNQLVRLDMNA